MKRMKQKLTLSSKTQKIFGAALICIVALAGAWIIKNGFAASPTATATCGARVSNYTYQVPWGNAVWNQPVCGLARHPKSAEYASRFYKWSNVNDGSPAAQAAAVGDLDTNFGLPQPTPTDPEGLSGLFSRNVYDAKDATTTMKIHAASYYSNLDGIGYNSVPLLSGPGLLSSNPDTPIPWNPDWKTGEGGDNEIVILDKQNGRIYEMSGYKRGVAAATQCGIFASDRLCTYTVNIGRDLSGNIFDYRTYEGVFDSRGVGLSMYATFTTPEEIAAGEIRHAIGISIPNTATGPICTSTQLGTSAEGTTCGTAVAPASKFEWGGYNSQAERNNLPAVFNSIYTQDKMIPEGMRFALDIDDAGIENWINSKPALKADARKAQTARIFARAMRDYGLMIVDTNGALVSMQLSGSVNPQTRQQWSNVGMQSTADYNIMDGLITSSNVYVVDPPTVKCKDGTTSKYYCKWIQANYGPTTSGDTVVPQVSISSPLNSASIKGTISVNATATDNVGVTKVEFLVDNVVKTSLLTGPYTFSFNSTGVADGVHTLTVKAYDAAGGSAKQDITVTVANLSSPGTADFNNDGQVNVFDLGTLISNYGKTVPAYTRGDCNGNGMVEIQDLGILISKYKK